MTSKRKLIRSTGIIGTAISSSRVMGFVRDILFARFFGTGIYAQAFVVAFRIPNMLRDLVGEGATNAAIVPVLTEYSHRATKKEYWEAARVIFYLLMGFTVILSAIGVVFAPFLVKLLAPGFIADPVKYSTAVALTRYICPYILVLGFLAYSKGVLNSLDYFVTPAFASVILNIFLIGSLLLLCPVIGIKGMVVGIFAAGIVQIGIQILPLVSRGFTLTGGMKMVHPVAARIGKLLFPRMIGTAVYQLSVLVDTILASIGGIVGAGGVAALYYSQRLIHLPLAIFGISLATAVLPRMTGEFVNDDIEGLKKTISFSLKSVFVIMVPASLGLIMLSKDIIRLLFQRGEFTAYSTNITSNALLFYAFGLFAYAGIKILVNAYYSMGDTKTPVRTASVALAINVVMNLMLMYPLQVGGLALATSIAAITNFLMLYVILVKRIGEIGTRGILISFGKICIAAVIMGSLIYIMRSIWHIFPGFEIVKIAVTIMLGFLVYILSAFILDVEGVRYAWDMVLRRSVR